MSLSGTTDWTDGSKDGRTDAGRSGEGGERVEGGGRGRKVVVDRVGDPAVTSVLHSLTIGQWWFVCGCKVHGDPHDLDGRTGGPPLRPEIRGPADLTPRETGLAR